MAGRKITRKVVTVLGGKVAVRIVYDPQMSQSYSCEYDNTSSLNDHCGPTVQGGGSGDTPEEAIRAYCRECARLANLPPGELYEGR